MAETDAYEALTEDLGWALVGENDSITEQVQQVLQTLKEHRQAVLDYLNPNADEPCERCQERAPLDPVSGLCPACTANNDERVVL